MVRDVSGARADAISGDPLDCTCDISMQSLLARGRDPGEQRLPHKFVAECVRPLRSLGARDDDSHLLGFFDHGEKIVNVDLADLSQKLKAETAPDHSGGGQDALFILLETIQAAPDDQPHVFRYVDLVDRDVSAELPGRVKDFPFLDQMPVQLLDEEWISLALVKDEARQGFRNLPPAYRMQHLRDTVL